MRHPRGYLCFPNKKLSDTEYSITSEFQIKKEYIFSIPVSQICPWTTKCTPSFGVQKKAGQRLTEFCQENTLVTANSLFQQCNRQLYTWTSPDGQYQNQIDCILSSQRCRSSIQSATIRSGANCGSDNELLTEKFRQIEENRENH